jgi:hypothetical protein
MRSARHGCTIVGFRVGITISVTYFASITSPRSSSSAGNRHTTPRTSIVYRSATAFSYKIMRAILSRDVYRICRSPNIVWRCITASLRNRNFLTIYNSLRYSGGICRWYRTICICHISWCITTLMMSVSDCAWQRCNVSWHCYSIIITGF